MHFFIKAHQTQVIRYVPFDMSRNTFISSVCVCVHNVVGLNGVVGLSSIKQNLTTSSDQPHVVATTSQTKTKKK